MALAVSALSPVIILTRMPARRMSAIASTTSGRGGSIIAAKPSNLIPSTAKCSCVTSDNVVATSK